MLHNGVYLRKISFTLNKNLFIFKFEEFTADFPKKIFLQRHLSENAMSKLYDYSNTVGIKNESDSLEIVEQRYTQNFFGLVNLNHLSDEDRNFLKRLIEHRFERSKKQLK